MIGVLDEVNESGKGQDKYYFPGNFNLHQSTVLFFFSVALEKLLSFFPCVLIDELAKMSNQMHNSLSKEDNSIC